MSFKASGASPTVPMTVAGGLSITNHDFTIASTHAGTFGANTDNRALTINIQFMRISRQRVETEKGGRCCFTSELS
jgi:hypothetical protein